MIIHINFLSMVINHRNEQLKRNIFDLLVIKKETCTLYRNSYNWINIFFSTSVPPPLFKKKNENCNK